jgi:predicted negative regulator of RcsB-dependent stress response
MASSVARRETRRAVDPDDAMMMRAAEMAAWARKNATTIMIAAAVALVVAGAFLYYQFDRSARAGRASRDYLQLQSALAADTGAAALRRLDSFARQYSGTPEADAARLRMAEEYLRAGRSREAMQALRPVADGDGPLSYQGKSLLGAAQAAANQRAQAIATYLEAAEESELNYQKQEALQQAALLREQAGDWRGALELYRRILDTTEEGSLERGIIELRIAESEARAAAGAAAPQR